MRKPHYTSSAGLEGIIRESKLRATLAKLTNDRAETEAGEKIVDDLLKSTWDSTEHNWLSSGISEHDINSTYFITCFSRVIDGSSMWQSYGNDGYAIAFDRAKLTASIDEGRSVLLQVQYGDEAFTEYARREIIAFRDNIDTGVRRGVYPGLLKAALKGSEWAGEQEMRLVRSTSIYGESFHNKDVLAGFAIGPFGSRPFLQLEITDKSCVQGVIAGPGPYMEERGHSAQWLLTRYGFSHVDVFSSSSTLRP